MASANPVRIMHVVRPAEGGIRQHVISLITRAQTDTISHSIAAPAAFLQALPPIGETARYPIEITAKLNLRADLRAAGQLRQLAPQYDIVHAHGLRAGLIASLASRASFPFIMTAHNVSPTGSFLSSIGPKLIISRAQKIIAVSSSVAESLIVLGVPSHKLVIIPNGINCDYFAEPLQSNITKQGFTVGCIARISHEKGIDILLEAAAQLPETQFVIAGDGPLREQLEPDSTPNVRWLGRIADTRHLLAVSDLLVIPSRTEGQGIVALEAMAAGVPIVASRVGGLAEMLTDGETARLVPPGNGALLAEAISHLRGDNLMRSLFVKEARKLVFQRYGVRQMVEAVTQLYQEIVK